MVLRCQPPFFATRRRLAKATHRFSGNAPSDLNPPTWPAPRESGLGSVAVASNLSEKDWAELMRLSNNSGATPRKVTGELPSTTPTHKLPSWADRGPQVDQLVNDSIRSEPLPQTAPASSKPLEPMRPWVEGDTQRQSLSSATNQAVGDYVLAKPDLDARWRQDPSFDRASDSGAVASKDAGGLSSRLLNESPANLMWPSSPIDSSRRCSRQ